MTEIVIRIILVLDDQKLNEWEAANSLYDNIKKWSQQIDGVKKLTIEGDPEWEAKHQ